MMNEKELLAHYKRTGDMETLGRLYAPYMSLLYGLCFKYLRDRAASQDAVMQIFEQLVGKLRIHEVDSFKSWLYVLARNHCLMELRRDRQKIHVDIEDNLWESEQQLMPPDGEKWTEGDFEKMEACLRALPEAQAVCVKMFYLDKKCYKDIAAETAYDLNRVKSCIQNGKRNLRLCMERRSNGK